MAGKGGRFGKYGEHKRLERLKRRETQVTQDHQRFLEEKTSQGLRTKSISLSDTGRQKHS